MPTAVAIRYARVEDAGGIADLLRELGYPNSVDFVRRKLRQLGQSDRDRVLVCTADSRVVGLASLHVLPLLHQEGNMCRATAVAVTEARRGQGIGRKLMQSAEAFARSNGCIRMEVTSGAQREGAHAFYGRLGYEGTSRRFVKVLSQQVSDGEVGLARGRPA
jgi:GNAT superfamily N-acetyltransferase